MKQFMEEVDVVYKEPKQLRVCFDEDVLQVHIDALVGPLADVPWATPLERWECFLYILGRFLQYVEESTLIIVPGMARVYDDLSLLLAVLVDSPGQIDDQPIIQLDRPYQTVGPQIYKMVYDAVKLIPDYDLEKEMDQPKKAFELVGRLDFTLKLVSHWMDLIRIIYGKHPKASPLVDYLTPLDALVDCLLQFPSSLRETRISVEDLTFIRAILTDPPQEFIEDTTLKMIECFARDVTFTISSVDLNTIDQYMSKYMSKQMCEQLSDIFGQIDELLIDKVKQIRPKLPKPSRSYYPKTGQLDFLELLVDNLGELLVKAKADPSIRVLKFDILLLQEKLQEVSRHLMEIPERRKEEIDTKDIITSIANLAYEAEYVIDSFLVGGIIPICYSMLWLRDILKELRHQQQLFKLQFGDAESIVRSIIRLSNFSELQFIPIYNNNNEIGDTLNQVFDRMRAFFPVCTRSLVSSYKERRKEVFLDLLRNALRNAEIDVDSKSNEIDYSNYTSDMSEVELEESVFSLLENKSYFVILEDVQDIYALNDIKRVLPHKAYRLKSVLLTTSTPDLVVQFRYGFSNISEHHSSTSKTDEPTIENDVVGFMEETKNMLEWLVQGPTKLQIISIVGTAGQGKTTLAKKLFSDPLVKEYFDTRAWCCVSQVYEKRELLLELLGQVVQLSNTSHHKDDEEIAEMLYKHLKGRRFLIFLDDIWEIGAWNGLRRCFTDDNNGSRIMLTTRIHGLASQAKSDSIVQSLGLLSDDESWTLLEKKLFQKESCPAQFLGVGRQIAKSCKGLPLSLVLTAGLLAKIEKSVHQWEQVAESLCSRILGDAEAQGKVVIGLSYEHLPDINSF